MVKQQDGDKKDNKKIGPMGKIFFKNLIHCRQSHALAENSCLPAVIIS
jgi:hypothetical protein